MESAAVLSSLSVAIAIGNFNAANNFVQGQKVKIDRLEFSLHIARKKLKIYIGVHQL